ncbi:MAG: hypothetical protein B6U73_03805 [Desulfurococcales archaeon ex4484_204]|nr:MAG: hypothetical protein B6U73_03805 [Desulfurococcales archaeon ex4484_204]
MVIALREFSSLKEFIKSIDDEINELRKGLGELLRKLEEVRIRAEQERKIRELLSKLGRELPSTLPNVIDFKNTRLILNPTPEQEVSSLEQAVESINNRVTYLQAIRKDLEVLGASDIEVKVVVIYVESLPRIILLKM